MPLYNAVQDRNRLVNDNRYLQNGTGDQLSLKQFTGNFADPIADVEILHGLSARTDVVHSIVYVDVSGTVYPDVGIQHFWYEIDDSNITLKASTCTNCAGMPYYVTVIHKD